MVSSIVVCRTGVGRFSSCIYYKSFKISWVKGKDVKRPKILKDSITDNMVNHPERFLNTLHNVGELSSNLIGEKSFLSL